MNKLPGFLRADWTNLHGSGCDAFVPEDWSSLSTLRFHKIVPLGGWGCGSKRHTMQKHYLSIAYRRLRTTIPLRIKTMPPIMPVVIVSPSRNAPPIMATTGIKLDVMAEAVAPKRFTL